MSTPHAKTPAELFDDFIKLEWQDIFRNEVHVKLDNGSRYVPNGGSQGVRLLRKNVNAFDAAIRLWSGPDADVDSGAKGYDRILEQAGFRYTWEWFLIEPGRPWASAVPQLVRDRIESDLERRRENGIARKEARAQDDERLAAAEDDGVIASMNARRLEEGKEPLSEQQEESVRERRRDQRAKQS